MSEPFLAEIRMVGFNFPPRGWAQCDGQILPINQNQSLFSLLGTTYGGDGRTTFALPDLRSRTPIHEGAGRNLGSKAGQERVTLTVGQIPSHNHGGPNGTVSLGNSTSPNGGTLARPRRMRPYHNTGDKVNMGQVLQNTGGGQSHENMMPFQVVNFCIALQGLFPSRN